MSPAEIHDEIAGLYAPLEMDTEREGGEVIVTCPNCYQIHGRYPLTNDGLMAAVKAVAAEHRRRAEALEERYRQMVRDRS